MGLVLRASFVVGGCVDGDSAAGVSCVGQEGRGDERDGVIVCWGLVAGLMVVLAVPE